MSAEGKAVIVLTPQQRCLVRQNIGLVAVHIKRNVANLSVPRRDREWEDLFQEGCLGLIRAAVAYRPERGIPFAAFALPRIHNAVSRALQRRFSTVYVPPKSSRAHEPAADKNARRHTPDRPRVHSLDRDQQRHLPDHRRHRPDAVPGETIGERLRDKYERAVRVASDKVSARTSTRSDRDKVVCILLEERLLVPNDESKVPLRSIARRTRSSYARVAQCERQLKELAASFLDADPEFHALRRRARTCPQGPDSPIDAELEQDLASASLAELIRRFRRADRTQRGQLLGTLLRIAPHDTERFIGDQLRRLASEQRETLLHGSDV
ncbi:MAG: sigma factor [Phycisphaerae bacterium]|jgi:hypothetical protein